MNEVQKKIKELALAYNNDKYFTTDPIIFPKYFYNIYKNKVSQNTNECNITADVNFPKITDYNIKIQDVEIVAVIAAHLAWGRRDMIVRDIKRALDEMQWKPYEYIMNGKYKSENASLHRTIKWSEFAIICNNLKQFYSKNTTLENLLPDEFRVKIYGQKSDKNAANKKIHMLRRWMVRNDGIVDMGIWKSISPAELIIPLDVHVHRTALELEITHRKSADITTAKEITDYVKNIFPHDPAIGDFALFAYAATLRKEKEKSKKNE